jgi:hypothetical protein
MPQEVGIDEIKGLIDRGAQVVDVLPEAEYDREHIAGAINIPLKQMSAEGVSVLDPGQAGDRLLPRLSVRHEPTGRVAARTTRVQRGLRLRRWKGRLAGDGMAERGERSCGP